jgi:hypothetical protein
LQSAEPRGAFADDRERASITLWFSSAAFHLELLVKEAPTGVTEPPSPVHAGSHVFYFYGPGGGGVSYPDVYYFDLHGQTLKLMFEGPYNGESKSPVEATRQIERRILASLRTF